MFELPWFVLHQVKNRNYSAEEKRSSTSTFAMLPLPFTVAGHLLTTQPRGETITETPRRLTHSSGSFNAQARPAAGGG